MASFALGGGGGHGGGGGGWPWRNPPYGAYTPGEIWDITFRRVLRGVPPGQRLRFCRNHQALLRRAYEAIKVELVENMRRVHRGLPPNFRFHLPTLVWVPRPPAPAAPAAAPAPPAPPAQPAPPAPVPAAPSGTQGNPIVISDDDSDDE